METEKLTKANFKKQTNLNWHWKNGKNQTLLPSVSEGRGNTDVWFVFVVLQYF